MIIVDDVSIKSDKPSSVALGYFDGVHLGHQDVISNAVNDSKINLIPTVFTFKDIPKFKKKGNEAMNILSLEDRISAFEKMGVKKLYSIDFEDIMNMDAREFIKEILVDTLNAKKVYCGFNYKFSKGKKADACVLKSLCSEYNIDVNIINACMYNQEIVSSSLIRECLKLGDTQKIKNLLSRYYSINRRIVKGKQIGRKLGFKTINQDLPNNIVFPRFGVYASFTTLGDQKFPSVTNIGVKPTFKSQNPCVETHMINYHGAELYDQFAKVELVQFIRDEKKFENPNALKNQIELDISEARRILVN